MPSVYAACEIQTTSARCLPEISYTGLLYITIHSLKHELSTAFTHGRDFNHVLELEEFASVPKNRDQVKPIVLAFVDGGPNENPRFPKVLSVTIDHFRKYELHVYIAVTHAPGMSVYNYVECRMAPLSKALAGVVLDHDACGTHLDDSVRTIDVELEKENFRVADKVLADMWSKLELDERPIIAEYVENKRFYPDDIDELWVSQHCKISQYILQIVKCNDSDCCGEIRSVWKAVFPKCFLPATVKMCRTQAGPQGPPPNDKKASDTFPNLGMRVLLDKIIGIPSMPHDRYCSSLQKRITSVPAMWNLLSTYCSIKAASARCCMYL